MDKNDLVTGSYNQVFLVNDEDQLKENSDREIKFIKKKSKPALGTTIYKDNSIYIKPETDCKKRTIVDETQSNILDNSIRNKFNDTITNKFPSMHCKDLSYYYNTKYNMSMQQNKKLVPLNPQNRNKSTREHISQGNNNKTLYVSNNKVKHHGTATTINLDNALTGLENNSVWPLVNDDITTDIRNTTKNYSTVRPYENDTRNRMIHFQTPKKQASPAVNALQNRMNLLSNILETNKFQDNKHTTIKNMLIKRNNMEKNINQNIPYKLMKAKPINRKGCTNFMSIWPRTGQTFSKDLPNYEESKEEKEFIGPHNVYQKYPSRKQVKPKKVPESVKESSRQVMNIADIPISEYLQMTHPKKKKSLVSDRDDPYEKSSFATSTNQNNLTNNSVPNHKNDSLQDSQYNQFSKSKDQKTTQKQCDSHHLRYYSKDQSNKINISELKNCLEEQAKLRITKNSILSNQDKKKLVCKLADLKNDNIQKSADLQSQILSNKTSTDQPKINNQLIDKDKQEYIKNISDMIKRDWLQSIIDNDKHIYKMPLINQRDKDNFKKYIKKKLIDLTMVNSHRLPERIPKESSYSLNKVI